jgi:predicted dehydrogenase
MAKSHIRAFEPLFDRMQFTGFADINLERAQEAADAVQGAVTVQDYKELFEHVDAVIVALPHDLHYPVGMDCLKAGKHVLMEKPLALNEEECMDLIKADTSPDPVLMVGYVMRHDPMWQKMGEYIRNKTFGDAFHVSIWTEQYTGPLRGVWFCKADRAGGGQLFSHGCHYIDLLLHWLGNPVCGTHVGTNFGTPWMEKEGSSNVSLKFENGATAYHFGTWGARGSKLKYAVHTHCTQGMLELDHAQGIITLHRNAKDEEFPPIETFAGPGESTDDPEKVVVYRKPSTGKALAEQMKAFLDCIEQKQKPELNAQSSLKSLRVIWRLYEAEEKGVVADFSRIT